MGDKFDKIVDKAYFIVDTLEGKCTCEECVAHNPPEPKTTELETTSYNEYVQHKVTPTTLDELEDAVFRLKAAGAVGDERLRYESSYDKTGKLMIKVKNGDLVLNGPGPKMMRKSVRDSEVKAMLTVICMLSALLILSVIAGIAIW